MVVTAPRPECLATTFLKTLKQVDLNPLLLLFVSV